MLSKSFYSCWIIIMCWRPKYYLWIIFLHIYYCPIIGQDIVLDNPSFEGPTRVGNPPLPWLRYGESPDTQPGCYGITQPAAHGDTYIGAVCGPFWDEGVTQKINYPLQAGKNYTLSFDLAYSPIYFNKTRISYGALAIYGGNIPGEKAEILWTSGEFYHLEWKRYTATLSPSSSYKYISLGAYRIESGSETTYSIVMLDNLSSIREIPQLILTVQNTCKNSNTGSAIVKVTGTVFACSYFWKPGGQMTNQISNLAAGSYEITVTAANGTTIVAEVTIKEEQFRNEVLTVLSKCNNNKENELLITTYGGTPPYRYYLNEEHTVSYVPVFKNLASGNYNLLVKDDRGCTDLISNISLIEPPPLQITSVHTQPVSCSETQDGRITLDVRGGTAPYSYSLDFHSWQGDSCWNQLDADRYYFQIKDNNGCKVTGTTEVTKNWRDCAVLVPTAFSPNGDGLNDIFRAKMHDAVRDFKLIVYNRWGQQVFQSNDPAQGWDGGQQTTGSYLWVLMYTDSKNQARKQQGNLMLIK